MNSHHFSRTGALALALIALSAGDLIKAAPLPEANPTVYKNYSSKQLLELSFVGVNRKNIRAYLAMYRADTVEGLFGKAWMLSNWDKNKEAVDIYTQVINDPRAWPRLRAIAAGNRSASAGDEDFDEAAQNRFSIEALKLCYAAGDLNAACNIYDNNDAKRKVRVEMHQRYPKLTKQQRAAYLLAEADYFAKQRNYAQLKKIVDEIWAMDMDQWKGDFSFSRLVDLRLTAKSGLSVQAKAGLLAGNEFPSKLLRYQMKVKQGVQDPVRRAVVAGWCNTYAEKLYTLDKRHKGLSLLAFQFLHVQGGSGSIGLFPTGDSVKLMMRLWDEPRDGTQMAKNGENPRYTLSELAGLLDKEAGIPDAQWYVLRANIRARLGRWSAAEADYRKAAECTFFPDERVNLIGYEWASNVLGPRKHDLSDARNQVAALMDKVSPGGRRMVCSTSAALAFAAVDLPSARRWYEQFLKEKSASLTWGNKRLEHIAYLENIQRDKARYEAANPIESKWGAEHGRKGVSVQLNFATNSDKLPSDTPQKLAPVVSILKDEAYKNLMFRVEGHTDSSGTDAINEPLSKRRAQRVAEYLVTKENIASSRMEVDGFGARRPIASNLSERGRTLNRRAELNLMGDASRPQLVATGALENRITAVSPDGRRMLSTSGDVWDTATWVRLYSVKLNWSGGGAVFSPDGRSLLVIHSDKINAVGVVLDARTGVVVQIIPGLNTNRAMFRPSWSPDSKRIALMTGSRCHVYNLEQQRYEGSAAVMGAAGSGYLSAWIAGGSKIAVVGATARKSLYTIDCSDWSVEAMVVPSLGYVHSMASSYDARYLYIGDDPGYVVDWDTLNEPRPGLKGFWRTAQSNGIRLASHRIQVHPGNPRLIALSGFHTKRWGIVDFEAGKVKAVKQPDGIGAPAVYWGRDGKELLLSGGWVANDRARTRGAGKETGIYRQDLRQDQTPSNQRLEFIKGESARLWGFAAFEELNLAVAVSNGDVSVWDVTTGRQMHSWSDGLSWYLPARKTEPGVLYGVLENKERKSTRIVKYDLNRFSRTEVANLGDFDVSAMSVGDGVIAVGGARYMAPNKGLETITLQVIDAQTGRPIARKDVAAATSPLVYGKISYAGFQDVEISPDGGMIAYVTKWADGYGYGSKSSKQIGLWNVKENQLLKPAKMGSVALQGIVFESDDVIRSWQSDSWNVDWTYSLSKGRQGGSLSKESRPNIHNTVDLDKAFAEKNLKIEYSSRGEIRFLRRDKDEVVVTILKKGGEWIAYNTGGYFAASSGGTNKVFWRVGTRMLPLQSLRQKFEQPALLADSMKSIFEKRVIKKAVIVKPRIDPDLFSIPYEIKVLSANGIETKGDKYTMKIEVEALSEDAPEPNVVWTVNGHTGRGFKVVPAKVAPRKYLLEHTFDLADGTNVFSAALRYKGAIVMPHTVSVRRAVKKTSPGAVAANTHLWFFGVGVKDYERVDQNLDYADRDAEELAKAMAFQQGKLYQKVHTKVLTNDKATVREIKIEMNRFFKQASAQDTVVIFLAGHGVLSTDQELYFMAHDSNMKEAYTGLELRAFSDFLTRRPSGQKALVMMDICHAGSFGQTAKRRGSGLTAEDAVKLVEQGTGTVVLASSTGRESSYEDKAYRGGHGAFTAALLDGLEGKADSEAGNGDGYVFLNELIGFVSREVPRLTEGAQHPTTPRMENFRDFPLGKRRP